MARMARSIQSRSLRVEFEPMERTVETWFKEGLTDAEKGELFADVALQALAEAQNQNRDILGYVPPHDTRIDNALSDDNRTSLERARTMIEFDFEISFQMYEWISELLIVSSPVGHGEDKRPGHPGLYQRSHVMAVDDAVHDPHVPVPPGAREIFFANTVPYARKIERGLSRQFPEGVYQSVARMAYDRFHNVANIKFSYRDLVIGGIHNWANGTKLQSKRGHKGPARFDWLRRQPAIVITPHERGYA